MRIGKEVCRIAKMKSAGALGGAYQHNLRLKSISNADEKRANYNIELTDRTPGKSYVDCFHEKIAQSEWYQNPKHKIAKNAIYGIEFMLTFSKEAADKVNIEQWCNDNLEWLRNNFGGDQNLISAILHVDEQTPHIHAIILPFDEKGKLNYTKYLGGSKYRLSEMQDSYHDEVGSRHDLERGLKGSKATHQDIDTFYSLVNESIHEKKLPEPARKEGIFQKSESVTEYRNRITLMVQHVQMQASAKEKENQLLKQRIGDIEHLQEGVVPLADHTALQKELSVTKADLKVSRQKEIFSTRWANEEKERREKLERSVPKKISDAVSNALSELQTQYRKLLSSFNSLKQKYGYLESKYKKLESDHHNLQKKYTSLVEGTKDTREHLRDKELMYAILHNNGCSHLYDMCKSEELDGYHFLRNMEVAKYKSKNQAGLSVEKHYYRNKSR